MKLKIPTPVQTFILAGALLLSRAGGAFAQNADFLTQPDTAKTVNLKAPVQDVMDGEELNRFRAICLGLATPDQRNYNGTQLEKRLDITNTMIDLVRKRDPQEANWFEEKLNRFALRAVGDNDEVRFRVLPKALNGDKMVPPDAKTLKELMKQSSPTVQPQQPASPSRPHKQGMDDIRRQQRSETFSV